VLSLVEIRQYKLVRPTPAVERTEPAAVEMPCDQRQAVAGDILISP